MKNFRTFELAKTFYLSSRNSPVPYYVKQQLNRAALSIALNLAEGKGRQSRKDQIRFFRIALGSARECKALVELHTEAFTTFQQHTIDRVCASIYLLIKNAH